LKIADAAIGMKDAEPPYFKGLGFSYNLLKQACDDYVRLYPDTNDAYLYNLRCYIACAFEDKGEATRLFNEIGPCWHKKVWSQEEIFNKYKNWAITKEEKPPEPNE
jgi:hypothetical protein